MSSVLQHTIALNQPIPRKPNAYLGLTSHTAVLFFQHQYIICDTLSGAVIKSGSFPEPLYYPSRLTSSQVVGVFLQKGCIVIFDLETGKMLISAELELRPPEWIDCLEAFQDGTVCYLSRDSANSSLNFLDKELRPAQKYKIGPGTITDKIEAESTMAAHSQSVSQGSIPIGLFRADLMKCHSLTITDISYPEDSLLQKVWHVGGDSLLLAFNHKNICFCEVHNMVTHERLSLFQQRDLMQTPVMVGGGRMSYIGIRKKAVNKQTKHTLYSIDIQSQAVADLPVFFEGDMTVLSGEAIMICETLPDSELKLRTYKLISKQNKYVHLMEKTGVAGKYGNLITQTCLQLLQ